MSASSNSQNNRQEEMERLKIKISVADRVYPMNILPEQEEGLRKAAKKIDSAIKKFEQNYAVRDKQDVLAMCALQFAGSSEQREVTTSQDSQDAEKRLDNLNAELDRILE